MAPIIASLATAGTLLVNARYRPIYFERYFKRMARIPMAYVN